MGDTNVPDMTKEFNVTGSNGYVIPKVVAWAHEKYATYEIDKLFDDVTKAAHNNNTPKVLELLDKCPNLAGTALGIAIDENKPGMIDSILDKKELLQEINGGDMIEIATRMKSPNLDRLLEAGLRPDGYSTAPMIAAGRGDIETLDKLRDAGIDFDENDLPVLKEQVLLDKGTPNKDKLREYLEKEGVIEPTAKETAPANNATQTNTSALIQDRSITTPVTTAPKLC